MTGTLRIAAMALVLFASQREVDAETIRGKVVSASGKAMEGVMVSAFDENRRQSISVFSQADGSFVIDGLRKVDHNVRARLLGQLDEWQDDVSVGTTGVTITMKPATGEDLERQRPANSAFGMLKWSSLRDKKNFKMMCMYCHQVGTIGFRTPEKPVDWETMLRRMDGFGGLYQHTQRRSSAGSWRPTRTMHPTSGRRSIPLRLRRALRPGRRSPSGKWACVSRP